MVVYPPTYGPTCLATLYSVSLDFYSYTVILLLSGVVGRAVINEFCRFHVAFLLNHSYIDVRRIIFNCVGFMTTAASPAQTVNHSVSSSVSSAYHHVQPIYMASRFVYIASCRSRPVLAAANYTAVRIIHVLHDARDLVTPCSTLHSRGRPCYSS